LKLIKITKIQKPKNLKVNYFMGHYAVVLSTFFSTSVECFTLFVPLVVVVLVCKSALSWLIPLFTRFEREAAIQRTIAAMTVNKMVNQGKIATSLRYPICLYTGVTPRFFSIACTSESGTGTPPRVATTLALLVAKKCVNGICTAKSHTEQKASRSDSKMSRLGELKVMKESKMKMMDKRAISADTVVTMTPVRKTSLTLMVTTVGGGTWLFNADCC